MFVQDEGAAGLGDGAAGAQRAAPRQAAPKVTLRRAVIRRMTPFGQVPVRSSSLTVKSSRVNPPSTAGPAAWA